MESPRISLRISSKVFDEVERLAVSNKLSVSDIARQLIHEALAQRAEGMTTSQFQHVENRLDYMERRFSGFMAKAVRGTAQCLYFCDLIFLAEASKDQKEHFRKKAEEYASEFLKPKGALPNAADETEENS